VLSAPGLNITVSLPRSGEKVVKFTPDKTGTFTFSCPMGMTTRGAAITVIANETGAVAPTPVASANEQPTEAPASAPAQKFTMSVTNEQGFYPNSFTAKKNLSVELEVDVKADISGCMDTMIGSDYDIAYRLKPGKNTVRFTPTKVGKLDLTCPMGIPMGEFTITN